MSDKEWKAMYELAIEQRSQARSESARLRAERDALRAAWREILSGHCPSKYPMTDAGLIAYHHDLARAALKEAK